MTNRFWERADELDTTRPVRMVGRCELDGEPAAGLELAVDFEDAGRQLMPFWRVRAGVANVQ